MRKIEDPDPNPDPDSLVRVDPRIRIHTEMSWIRNTSVNYGSKIRDFVTWWCRRSLECRCWSWPWVWAPAGWSARAPGPGQTPSGTRPCPQPLQYLAPEQISTW